MKFEETAEYTYWWPMKIPMPNPERPGQWKEETFDMLFVGVSEDEAKETQAAIDALETDEEKAAHNHDQLLNASRDWRGVIDGDKKPVPFSRDLLLKMLRAGPWYRAGIYKSYLASLAKDGPRKGN